MAETVNWAPPRAMTARRGTAPSVLAFDSDDFISDLQVALAAPAGLDGRRARPETWRTGAGAVFPAPPPSTDDSPVTKLFQPVHGRFYLVAAHLTCRRYGQPDRRLAREESVGFVVRRLGPDGEEHAWRAGRGGWVAVADPYAHQPGEEVLPLSPITHRMRDRRSRLWTGLVPVSARERYQARATDRPSVDTGDDANAQQLAVRDTVIAPLHAIATRTNPSAVVDAGEHDALELALVDLVDWLDRTGAELPDAHRDENARGGQSWGEVVDEVAEHREEVLAGEHDSDARRVTDRGRVRGFLNPSGGLPADPAATELALALEPRAAEPPGLGAGFDDVDLGPDQEPAYVFRAVYGNTACARPRAAWVSDATDPFRFAGHFDPDAPARPVQISLPVDTSPRGLRQFPRNVSVLLTSQLRRQMTQINEDLETRSGTPFGIGALCTLSIPIITLCAMLLLLVMVSILNLVFFWLPFFKVCVPMPTPEPGDGS